MRLRLSNCRNLIRPVRKIFLLFILGGLSLGGWPSLAGSSTAAFSPRLGTFYYKINWGRMTVANAALTVAREAEHFRIALESESDGTIEHFYRMKYTGEGKVSQADFEPLGSVFKWRKGSSEKTTSVYNHGDGEMEAVEVESKAGRNLKQTVRNIQSESEVFDIFSAMVLARNFDWKVGHSERFEVFTGRKTYLVTLNCINAEVYEEGDRKVKAWVIAPSVIDPAKAGEKPRLTSSRVYLSADDSKDILRIKTKIGIGNVEANLKEFKPASN